MTWKPPSPNKGGTGAGRVMHMVAGRVVGSASGGWWEEAGVGVMVVVAATAWG